MFGNKMQTSAIPERVYALCKMLSSKPMDENVVKSLLEPEDLGGKTAYFGTVKIAADQLKLICTKENTIALAVDKGVIKSMANMRQYVNTHLEMISEGLFYKVTQGYFDMGTEVLSYNSVSKMSDIIGRHIGERVIEDDMRAWRFWMAFLGFGYMHDPQPGVAGILLSNPGVFLRDVIEYLGIKKKEEYTIDQFVSIIQPYSNIVLHNVVETKVFNYGTSNAIRTLHDLGVIKAEHRLDAQKIWALHPFDGHELDSTITHVTIGG